MLKYEYEKKIMTLEREMEQRESRISNLEKQLTDKQIESDYKDEKTKELEKWLQLFMSSVTSNLQQLGNNDYSLFSNPVS